MSEIDDLEEQPDFIEEDVPKLHKKEKIRALSKNMEKTESFSCYNRKSFEKCKVLRLYPEKVLLNRKCIT
jgi:hypothetical protein